MNTCIKCGSESWALVKSTRLVAINRCGVCGHEQLTLFTPSEDPVPPANLEPVFKVMARWRKPPTLQQVRLLKSHFRLMPESVADLLRSGNTGEPFSLGNFVDSEMDSHTTMLEKLGLEFERMQVTREVAWVRKLRT